MSNNNSSAKWKRFSGASYASFQSLHREVQIGVLSVAMLTSVGLKANAGTTTSLNAASQPMQRDLADSDSLVVGLEDVEILASRVPLTQMQAPRLVTVLSAVDIAAAAVHSVNDLLEYAVGVDVRQRGEFGVQTDISVRGGTFDQITLLLNGVNISSPHTGHLSADFPVSVHDIERIEVLEGPSARVFGTSAFTGVINIVTKNVPDTPQAKHDLSVARAGYGATYAIDAGSYGYAQSDLNWGFQIDDYHLFASAGLSHCDGATPNSEFDTKRLFLQSGYGSGDNQVNLQLGYSYKPYCANTFYGASSTDQWESNERYIGSLTGQYRIPMGDNGSSFHVAPALSFNRWFDHYQWHKDKPAGENYHQVDTWSASLNNWFEYMFGKTLFGFEMRNEGIYSTKLGEPMEVAKYFDVRGHDGLSDSTQYTHHANRTNISAYVEQDILFKRWSISLGMLANMNTALDTRWRLYPGIDVSYRPSRDWKLFASWNMALRMPTFTDLYYSGANIEGTSNLKPERTNDVSLSARYRRPGWRVETSVFYSHKSDMIDWVVYADELAQAHDSEATGIFRSGNFKLDNLGFEVQAAFLPRELWSKSLLQKFSVQYSYIDEHIDYARQIAKSKYAMEYLRHKVVLQADGRLFKQLTMSLAWRWQERVGPGNVPYDLLDGRLSWDSKRPIPHSNIYWSVYASCSNLLDKQYFDYSFIPQPGRWGKFGFMLKF